ncbi:response regulator [Collimonas sp.]|jgi:hypothetical protein|uniref:response regulator n=1 Tax=Collimonas sp. TaxID=1963772 RepID=UPI002B58FD86|nr:response regulator [Collimonas sp.]HWW05457.1 response regulator [Collimonas sp.]
MNELKSGAKKMAHDDARILALVNGKSTIGDLAAMLDAHTAKTLTTTLELLCKLGLIRVFSQIDPDARSGYECGSQQPLEMTADGMIKFTPVAPSIEVTELSPQEGVQLWAEARRGASILQSKGFYTYGEGVARADTEARKQAAKVVIVEDDETLCELLEKLLTHKEFEVETAARMATFSSPSNGKLCMNAYRVLPEDDACSNGFRRA